MLVFAVSSGISGLNSMTTDNSTHITIVLGKLAHTKLKAVAKITEWKPPVNGLVTLSSTEAVGINRLP